MRTKAKELQVPSLLDFNIKDFRESIDMSQSQFAKAYSVPVGTLRKWERNSSRPILNDTIKLMIDDWIAQQMTL